jgi:chromosome condensin MukBEF MukE localization factor
MTVIGIQMGQESLRPRAVILGMALVFLALELVLLPIVLPLLHNQGRGVSSASKIDMARRDYDSLRSFYDTTATGNQLVKHVLKRTNGKDLSDRAFDTVRAAIERCRVA